jgi:hypothetical protein
MPRYRTKKKPAFKVKKNILLDSVLVILLSFFILSPIIVFPHWGLFSDAGQILTFPKEVIESFPESLNEIRPLADGRWNPMFHLITIGIYFIFGENPQAFYITQWTMLAIVSLLIFYLTKSLSSSRLASYGAVILLLFNGTIFENFFTLDKIEPRVGLFAASSFILMSYFLKIKSASNLNFLALAAIFIIHFFLSILSIFSKETGIFLLPVGLILFILAFMQKKKSKVIIMNITIFFLAHVLALVLFKVLFDSLDSNQIERQLRIYNDNQYIAYKISPSLIKWNFNYYLTHVTEAIIGSLVFVGWSLILLFKKRLRHLSQNDFILLGTGTAGSIYFFGLLLWRWPSSYFLYPSVIFYSIFLSSHAYFLFKTKSKSYSIIKKFLLMLILIIVVLYSLPGRIYNGLAIYSLDETKDIFAGSLCDKSGKDQKIVLAQFHPDSAELGERLEFFIDKKCEYKNIDIFNMIEGPFTNRNDFDRYRGGAGLSPSKNQMKKANDKRASYIMWSFGPFNGNPGAKYRNEVWFFAPLKKGDWIAVPVGNARNRFVPARGVQLYSQPSKDYLNGYFSGIELKKIDDSKLSLRLNKTFFMGWEIYEVIKINRTPAIGENWFPLEAFTGETFRWVNNDASFTIDKSDKCAKLIVDLEPGPGIKGDTLNLNISDNETTIKNFKISKRKKISLILPSTITPASYKLHVINGGRSIQSDPRILNFRVFKIELIDYPCEEKLTS